MSRRPVLRVSHGRQGRWCWLRAAGGALRRAAPLWWSLVAAYVWLVGEGVGIGGVAIGKEALDDAGKAMRPEPSQEPGTRALGNAPQCCVGGVIQPPVLAWPPEAGQPRASQSLKAVSL